MARSDWIAAGALALSAFTFIWSERHRAGPPEIVYVEEWSAEHLRFLPDTLPYLAARDVMQELLEIFPPEAVESGYLYYAIPGGFVPPHLRYTHTVTVVNIGDRRATGVKIEIDDQWAEADIEIVAPKFYSPSVNTVDSRKVIVFSELHPGIIVTIILHRHISIDKVEEENKIPEILNRWQRLPSKVRLVVSDTTVGKSETKPNEQCLKWLKRCVTQDDVVRD